MMVVARFNMDGGVVGLLVLSVSGAISILLWVVMLSAVNTNQLIEKLSEL